MRASQNVKEKVYVIRLSSYKSYINIAFWNETTVWLNAICMIPRYFFYAYLYCALCRLWGGLPTHLVNCTISLTPKHNAHFQFVFSVFWPCVEKICAILAQSRQTLKGVLRMDGNQTNYLISKGCLQGCFWCCWKTPSILINKSFLFTDNSSPILRHLWSSSLGGIFFS